MAKICQECGDRGFTNALIYCVECLSFAIHRYCLDILPKTVHEFVPWVCEDCKPKVPNQSTFTNHNSIRSLGKDDASSIHGEEIHSRKKLKKTWDPASLVDAVEVDSCQEAIEQDLRRIPFEDSPLKVNLRKRKNRDSACLVDGTKEGSGRKVITEPDHGHVPLAGSPMKLDMEKQKKIGNNASLLNGTEVISSDEAIGEPDREFVSLPDASLKVNLNEGRKERDVSSLVDGAEEDSRQKRSTELDQECIPLAELCLKAKLMKKKKKRPTDSLVAGTEEDNCRGGVTKEPDRQHAPLADSSPLKVKLNKKEEKHTALDVKENRSCLGAATEPDRQHTPLADSPVKVKLNNRKKEKCSALDVKENNSCPGAAAGPENECAPLADSPSKVRVKFNLKSKRDMAHTEARASDLKSLSIPSQQPSGVDRKHELAENAELAGCCSPLKRKSEITERDASCSVSGIEDKRLQNSPNDPPHESCTKIELKKKDAAWSAEEQKRQFDSSQQPLEADKKLDIADHGKLVSSGCPSLKLELDKKRKDNKHTASKTEDKRHQSRFHQQPPMVHIKQDIDRDKHLNIEKERRMIKKGSEPGHEGSQFANFANNFQQDVHGHAQPVIEPIWRGSFDIVNKDYETFEGFVGHVSSKVCLKVFEEASLLPSLLCLEMLPKSDLWPKSFQEYKPSDENIALYFFPADSKHERVFDHLVEDMMNQELAMRAVVTNAELLIFASTELPRSFWRFQGKYYLWGVFKGKRVDPSLLNQPLVLPKGSDGSAPRTNPLHEVVREPRNLTKMKTLDAESSPRTLSNIG